MEKAKKKIAATAVQPPEPKLSAKDEQRLRRQLIELGIILGLNCDAGYLNVCKTTMVSIISSGTEGWRKSIPRPADLREDIKRAVSAHRHVKKLDKIDAAREARKKVAHA